MEVRKRFPAVLKSVAVIAVLWGILSIGSCAEAYDNTYPFSFLEGTWTMSNGSGTVLTTGGSGTMTLKNGTVRFSALFPNAADTGGTAAIKMTSSWRLSSGGNSTNYPINYQLSQTFTNTGVDEYTISYADGTVSGKVVITLTGAMKATVAQTEKETAASDAYTVALTYNLTQTDDDDEEDEEDSSSGCSAGWPALALLAGVPLFLRRGARR